MSLADTIGEELKNAMRARDEAGLAALRALRNEIIKFNKSGHEKEITDDDVIRLIKTQVKQRQDAIEMFKKGERSDLVKVEQAQIEVLEKYLPEQLTPAEMEGLVADAIRNCSANSLKDMGKVMKIALSAVRQSGKDVDNRLLSQSIRSSLSA